MEEEGQSVHAAVEERWFTPVHELSKLTNLTNLIYFSSIQTKRTSSGAHLWRLFGYLSSGQTVKVCRHVAFPADRIFPLWDWSGSGLSWGGAEPILCCLYEGGRWHRLVTINNNHFNLSPFNQVKVEHLIEQWLQTLELWIHKTLIVTHWGLSGRWWPPQTLFLPLDGQNWKSNFKKGQKWHNLIAQGWI